MAGLVAVDGYYLVISAKKKRNLLLFLPGSIHALSLISLRTQRECGAPAITLTHIELVVDADVPLGLTEKPNLISVFSEYDEPFID